MIRAIAPQFFTTDLVGTLAYYRDVLGFETQFDYGDPPFYAGMIRDGQSIFLRLVDTMPPTAPDKLEAELLDVYIFATDIHGLWQEYRAKGVQIHRPLGDTPWGFTEFVVQDCDGRLLCFGQFIEELDDDAESPDV